MEELITVLKRIAEALEVQNLQNEEWIELHRQRYQDNDPLTGKIVAIHEANAAKEQAWRDQHTKELNSWLAEQRQLIKVALKGMA